MQLYNKHYKERRMNDCCQIQKRRLVSQLDNKRVNIRKTYRRNNNTQSPSKPSSTLKLNTPPCLTQNKHRTRNKPKKHRKCPMYTPSPCDIQRSSTLSKKIENSMKIYRKKNLAVLCLKIRRASPDTITII
jgi:hypothetical protein